MSALRDGAGERVEAPAATALRAPPSMRAVIAALLRKELRVELRTFESIPAMSLFSVTTYVLFHFGLQQDTVKGALASGVLWVTLLFASVLGINRLFVADAEQGGFDGFLLSPADRSALLFAKALALFIYLVVLELIAVPAFALLLLGSSLAAAMPGLLLVPVVIGCALATTPLFSVPAAGPPLRWLLTLGLYDLVFAVIAFALFDFLLED